MFLVNREVTYSRRGSAEEEYRLTKLITFLAQFVDVKASKPITNLNRKAHERSLGFGVDKVGLCIPLDYVNEDHANTHKYSNGLFSTRKHGAYLHIEVHGEYLGSQKIIFDQIKSIVYYLGQIGFFKLPLQKTTYHFSREEGEVSRIEEEVFSEKAESFDQFMEIIWAKVRLSCLEVKFDYEMPILGKLRNKDFNVVDDTLYSKDYRTYRGGTKIKSSLCIYNKAEQIRNVKKQKCETSLQRIEFRLFSRTLQYHFSMDSLKTNILGLLNLVTPLLIKKLRKQKIDFSALVASLPSNDLLRRMLEDAKTENLEDGSHSYVEVEKVGQKTIETTSEHEEMYKITFLGSALIRTGVSKLSNKIFYLIKMPDRYTLASYCLGP